MLNPYKYCFKTFVVTKDGRSILLENDTQQLFLLTDEEANEVYEHSFGVKEWGEASDYFICTGWKHYSFYRRITSDLICRVQKDNFDHLYFQRTFVPVSATVYEILKNVEDVSRVFQYFHENGLNNLKIGLEETT